MRRHTVLKCILLNYLKVERIEWYLWRVELDQCLGSGNINRKGIKNIFLYIYR